MFCTACGTHQADEARFCTFCGQSVALSVQYLPEPTRRLHRDRFRKKIGGVCAGFAEYFGMDVSLMRLIWLGLLLMPPNIGLIAYFVAWAVLPKQ